MKTVLITGAGGNLGAACVVHFAAKGWKVIAMVSPGRIPKDKVTHVRFVEADLMNEQDTEQVLGQVLVDFPSIDLAVLTVGGFEMGTVEQTDGASLQRMYALNFETAYHVARPLFAVMQRGAGGRIVFIGARPALDAKAGKSLIAYGLSKSLLFKLAEYLNAASEKVRCHVVVFSALDTPQNRASMPNADTSKWVKPERVAARIEEVTLGTFDSAIVEVN